MKRIRAMSAGVLAAALAGAAPAALAEEPRPVSVAITNVAPDIARNIGIDASQIPLNIQLPMDVAAAVCGVATGTLARQADGGIAQCTAQRTSAALDDIVLQRVRHNAGR